MPIPVETVHLTQFQEGDARDRADFVRRLGDSLRDTGFVKVAGHRVDAADLRGAYEAARTFFALPEEVKRRYFVEGSGGARGFTPFGSEHAKDAAEGEIVADAGDMLSRHVNLKIPSTTHRVVNPDSPDAVRYSMPFFCHPRPEVVLDCPEALLEPGEARHFPPLTAQAFLLQRLREIGLIN